MVAFIFFNVYQCVNIVHQRSSMDWLILCEFERLVCVTHKNRRGGAHANEPLGATLD